MLFRSLTTSDYPVAENVTTGSQYFFCGWADASTDKYGEMPVRLTDEVVTSDVTILRCLENAFRLLAWKC